MSPGRRRFEGLCGSLLLGLVLPRDAGAGPAAAQAAASRRARADFDALAGAAARLPAAERIAFANVAINQLVDYEPDDADDADVDRWSTPVETLACGHGDCEDFAIAKFFLLLASALPRTAVRLLYARRGPRGEPHVVALARWPFDDPWVLDNVNPMMVPLSARDDLVPQFSFDERSVWDAVGAASPRGIAGLRIWSDVVARTGAPAR